MKNGNIDTKLIFLNEDIAKQLSKKYIAIDVETTGLDYRKNVVIEMGLALYEDCKLVKTYNSLVKINDVVPKEIEDITGITNDMLKTAPEESEVYTKTVEFLNAAMKGEIILTAHNADFDMGFLKAALNRYGYSGTIKYVDTLHISRNLVKGLFNYKQDSVAKYFGIVNKRAHRALYDAEVCGEILNELLKIYENGSQIITSTKYDDLFTQKIRERGYIYHQFDLVNNYKKTGNKYFCQINGTNKYDVTMEISDGKLIGTCTCPHFQDNNILCKHIYALLLTMENNDKK